MSIPYLKDTLLLENANHHLSLQGVILLLVEGFALTLISVD